MKNIKNNTIIKSIKIITGVLLGIAWILVIIKISDLPLPFSEQAPYCMGSTMVIFMLLSGVYKGLDYLYNYKTI